MSTFQGNRPHSFALPAKTIGKGERLDCYKPTSDVAHEEDPDPPPRQNGDKNLSDEYEECYLPEEGALVWMRTRFLGSLVWKG